MTPNSATTRAHTDTTSEIVVAVLHRTPPTHHRPGLKTRVHPLGLVQRKRRTTNHRKQISENMQARGCTATSAFCSWKLQTEASYNTRRQGPLNRNGWPLRGTNCNSKKNAGCLRPTCNDEYMQLSASAAVASKHDNSCYSLVMQSKRHAKQNHE